MYLFVGYTPRGTEPHTGGTGHEDYPLDWDRRSRGQVDDRALTEAKKKSRRKEFELVPDEQGYRKLIKYLKGLDGEVRIVYEAGPCGYELYRRLTKAGYQVPGGRAGADAAQAGRAGQDQPARCGEAGALSSRGRMLTLIAVPDQERESLRDLVRARQAVQKDLRQHPAIRSSKLLLRYGHRYREGKRHGRKRFWAWLKQDQARRRAQPASCSTR